MDAPKSKIKAARAEAQPKVNEESNLVVVVDGKFATVSGGLSSEYPEAQQFERSNDAQGIAQKLGGRVVLNYGLTNERIINDFGKKGEAIDIDALVDQMIGGINEAGRSFSEYIADKEKEYGDKFSQSGLNKDFIKYFENGQRVEVDMMGDGSEIKRGRVGVTTGWGPVFILMLTTRSIGSSYVIGPKSKIVKVVAESATKRTWAEIQEDYVKKYGKNHHHLRLKCTECDNSQTCRCSHPKTLELGICPDCAAKMNESVGESKTGIPRPPKAWAKKAIASIKKKNPSWSMDRVRKTMGKTWYDEMTDKSRAAAKRGPLGTKHESMDAIHEFEEPLKTFDYKGRTIELYRSGWYSTFSDAQGMFIKADTLDGMKKMIDKEEGTESDESVDEAGAFGSLGHSFKLDDITVKYIKKTVNPADPTEVTIVNLSGGKEDLRIVMSCGIEVLKDGKRIAYGEKNAEVVPVLAEYGYDWDKIESAINSEEAAYSDPMGPPNAYENKHRALNLVVNELLEDEDDVMPPTDVKVAETILQQLGGRRFTMMTGARGYVAGEYFLMFRLPKNAKDGINKVKITLNGKDLYDVEFIKLGPAPTFKVTKIAEENDVYAEDLRKVFEQITGLHTSLGTMGEETIKKLMDKSVEEVNEAKALADQGKVEKALAALGVDVADLAADTVEKAGESLGKLLGWLSSKAVAAGAKESPNVKKAREEYEKRKAEEKAKKGESIDLVDAAIDSLVEANKEPEKPHCKFCGRTMRVTDNVCDVCQAKLGRGATLTVKYPVKKTK